MHIAVKILRVMVAALMIAFGLLVIAGIVHVSLGLRGRSQEKPGLSPQNPTSVDLLIGEQKIVVITNPAPLLSLLRSGRYVDPHSCPWVGRMFFHYDVGTVSEVDIRPGHGGTNYEFSCPNGDFAVARPAFLLVLASAGADTNNIPTPAK